MVATLARCVEREIAAIRVRRGWRGKLILQVRRRVESFSSPFCDPQPAGLSAWRDADANNPDEVAEAVSMMQSNT